VTAKRSVSPTVRRRRLGAELRRYREQAGLTIDHVAERLDCSASKISRLETGQTGSSPRDVRDMLALYGVDGAELEELLVVARETRQRGWWQPYGSVLTGAFIGFEAAAQQIRSYEAQFVPGLLQTEEYARSLMQGGTIGRSPDEIESRVRVRMARQTLLTQDESVDFWCVMDEAALLRPIGGAAVMHDQLDRLVAAAELPHVTLQVLPLQLGAHPGLEGSFVLLSFPDEADPDTVYVTMATGGVFQEKPDDLARFSMIFDSLQRIALPPDESAAFIATLAKEPQ
jgi:transcriptional regulator with XRE-family HTH domain